MSISPTDLALDLGLLQPDDVLVIVESIVDLPDEDIPDHVAAEVRRVLDVDGVRTAPARLYWPGVGESAGSGIDAGSPTREEGDYPELEG